MRLVPMRRFRELKPYTKVGMVAVVLVAGGVALLVVSLVRFGAVKRTTDELRNRALPARDQLTRVDQSLELTTYKFTSILIVLDADARVIALEETRRQLTVTETEWNRFKEVALRVPGESELWDRFEQQQERQQALAGPVGLALIEGMMQGKSSGDLIADPQLAELRLTQRIMSDTVRELDDRFYRSAVEAQTDQADAELSLGQRDLWISYGSVLLVSGAIAIIVFRSARAGEREREGESQKRRVEAARNELETRLYRALEMATSEEAALDLVGQALEEAIPGHPAEVLVADTSVAHFRQAVTTDPVHRLPGCPVVSPSDCPAASRGNTLVFASSSALDACPFLRERFDQPVAAVCQPVSIAGKSVGVIHATFDDGLPAGDESLGALELIGRRAGERVGMLRAFAESESAARSDPLTGLLNRRSLDSAVRRLSSDGAGYAVAYGDLDHFKRLNDEYGHDVGDRALRLFSKVLRDAVRPNDLACRYGGEEFVVVLPDCPIEEALPVIERVRAAVADIGTTGRVPGFTVSFGLAGSNQADTFERVVALADAALMKAKNDGRDRVVVATGAWKAGAIGPAGLREIGTGG